MIALKSTFELLNVDRVHLNKSWFYPDVVSPFYRLYFLDEGEAKLTDSKGVTFMRAGYLYLVPSYTMCTYSCDSYMVQNYIQLIEESADGVSLFERSRNVLSVPVQAGDEELIRRLLFLNPGRGLPIYNPDEYQHRPVIQEFKEKNRLLSLSAYVETKGILLQLVSRFLGEEIFKREADKPISKAVVQAMRYIQMHLSEQITVADLAREVNLNPDYLSRIFFAHTGERPLNYIQFKRVEHAQFLMLTTELPLFQIALECGFDSLSYFSRIFKRIVGQAPSVYKGQVRAV